MQIANINGFDRILCDHDDGMIAKTIMYATGEQMAQVLDGEIVNPYIDAECTIHATKEEIAESVVKGLVIKTSTGAMVLMLSAGTDDPTHPDYGLAAGVAVIGDGVIGFAIKGVD